MSEVVFVDTETTGLDPDRHEIWDVGLITPDGEEHQWFLPVDLGRADSVALSIGRFHDRYERDMATHPEDFAWEFAQLTRGKHLAGAVISFDEERLRKLLRAHGACPEWHYHLIDVEALAVGFLHGLRTVVTEYEIPTGGDSYGADVLKAAGVADTLPWSSYDVSRALGVEPPSTDEQHSAIADARWAKRLYEAVVPPAVYTEPRPVPARWRDLP